MTLKNSNQNRNGISTLVGPYMIFLFSYMMLYEFFDTYTTSYYSIVVSYIQADFGMDHSQWYGIMAIASLGMFVVLINQLLADIIGRKPMMIIVFLGMGVASLILFMSKTITGFALGFFLLWMFFSSDIWVIIVSEEAPREKRARYTYLVALFGALGAIAIPICRGIFIHADASVDPTLWRTMTYLAMAAIPLSLLGFGMKETRAFKLRKEKPITGEDKRTIGKLKEPFGKETRSRMLTFMAIGLIFGLVTAAVTTLEVYFSKIVGDVEIVTNVFYVATIGTFVFFGITGLLADKFGRKAVMILYVSTYFTTVLMLVFLIPVLADSQNYLLIYLIAFLSNGSFWGGFMMSKTYCVECFPTEIRGTSAGWRSMSYALGITIGALISSALAKSLSLGAIYIIFSGIAVIVIPFLVKTYLPETRGLEIVDV
ncbi:MAG: MFS transporter [Deltaproteobacteria bacterium]|jgi:MFS family permease|nr:MFS transporter [Deltaproteobacteria bacterium]MBT4264704.1 MFS transporter [Deltaproteobacteria bacterium]MBT4637562.1 MFS transporter [Deltaproteobacteria bacterium]MBT6501635.1 MFS transporter [Deltaproteobacteria bacterium]MBT6615921.1 MFS transporter [Deltaproteobacteria bacterium]